MPRLRTALAGPALLVIALGSAGCGSSGSPPVGQAGPPSATPHTARTATTSPPQLRGVTVRTAGSLRSGLADPALARLNDGRLVLLGGLDQAGGSTAAITVLAGTGVSRQDMLPNPQHDAQAAALGPNVYVFGGGDVSSYSHILRYDPATGQVSTAGALPTAASDVAVAAIGDTAYIVGGYDGSNWLDTILAWKPGGSVRVVGHLPFGVRYAAVAAAGNRLIIAGGRTTRGVTEAVFRFDPASGEVVRIGHLPFGLAHAAAATIRDSVLVVGGRLRPDGDQTASILAIDPGSGKVRRVGQLPHPLSDAAIASTGWLALLVGGETASGPQSTVLALTPRRSARNP